MNDIGEAIEGLRMRVMAYGQNTMDKRKIWMILKAWEFRDLSSALRIQISRDAKVQYKFYDSLSMWLGQWREWELEDVEFLCRLGRQYIEGGK